MHHEVRPTQHDTPRNAAQETPADAPAAYERPALERLGSWSALTLVQTVVITP